MWFIIQIEITNFYVSLITGLVTDSQNIVKNIQYFLPVKRW